MNIQTHSAIDRGLCGKPLELEEGRAVVRLETRDVMRADERGLVHGGFLFGALDYAAMLAVNHPHVVLGKAEPPPIPSNAANLTPWTKSNFLAVPLPYRLSRRGLMLARSLLVITSFHALFVLSWITLSSMSATFVRLLFNFKEVDLYATPPKFYYSLPQKVNPLPAGVLDP